MPPDPIRVGVSSCLLGATVRYDGQHKRDDLLARELGPLVEWVPVCPEVEVGMGVPRESVRLVRAPVAAAETGTGTAGGAGADAKTAGGAGAGAKGGRSLMLGNQTGEDWTARMEAFAARRVDELALLDLAAYVLKSRSPSCGMEGVSRYPTPAAAEPTETGVGLFAAELRRRFPNLPVEEEGRFGDPRLREHFIERLFAYDRLRRLWRTRWGVPDLMAFHTAHETALRAHAPGGDRALEQLLATATEISRAELEQRYESAFMRVLGTLPNLADPCP